MVEVRYKARLGNNLFQYCAGRILAEALGYELSAEPIPGFPNTSHRVTGLVHTEPDQVLTGQKLPVGAIIGDSSPRRIILDGWFQQAESYRPYRADIQQWLAMDPGVQVSDEQPDLVIHVRRTDYIQVGWALPYSYYETAIKNLLPPNGSLWIVTDDAADPFFWNFNRWKPRFFHGNSLEQIKFMISARRLIMSQSTFSWWPAFLTQHPQEVACPVPAFGCWAEGDAGLGTSLIERDRFLCIECPEPYKPSAWEALYQRWRLLKRRAILKLNRDLGIRLHEPPQ
jgi:hypothetical protein